MGAKGNLQRNCNTFHWLWLKLYSSVLAPHETSRSGEPQLKRAREKDTILDYSSAERTTMDRGDAIPPARRTVKGKSPWRPKTMI
jgi:hypothetical protein